MISARWTTRARSRCRRRVPARDRSTRGLPVSAESAWRAVAPSIEMRRRALLIDDGPHIPLPLSDHAIPLGRLEVVVHLLVEVDLRHVEADDAALENAVVEDALLAEDEHREAELVRHRGFDVRPRRREPGAVDWHLFEPFDIGAQPRRSFFDERSAERDGE